MPIPVTGEMMLAYAGPMMQAIEMIPESSRNFVLWTGTFKTAEGEDKELSAMTPAHLAADVVTALDVMPRFVSGEMSFSPELFQRLREANQELAKKPLAEIAALGRERARAVAALIDDEYSCGSLKGDLDLGGRTMSRHAMALLIFTHLVHHRGQLFQMLRAVGVAPPGFLGPL